MTFRLIGVEVENLRGYSLANISLERRISFIVGPNNSGKTSIIKLLDWFLNKCDEKLLQGSLPLNQGDLDFLLPARDSRHRARRFTMLVRVTDRRSHNRYQCVEGIARLRFNIRLTPTPSIYVTLGYPSRSEPADSTSLAIELLDRLRSKLLFIYIPSFREGASSSFKDTLLKAFHKRLEARIFHVGQGGANREERKIANALRQLTHVSENLSQPLWQDLQQYLPSGMIAEAPVRLDLTREKLVDILCDNLGIKISTGEHDNQAVPITEVGAGLQSLLVLAINLSELHIGKRIMVAMEEPESFLHPAAQRAVARQLRSIDFVNQVIVTTHSPIVVEEARFGEIVICQDQRFYEAKVEDERREDINTALLAGYGAEMMFASSVLLVEGEGDRQFFERLRRRLAVFDASGRIDSLFVIPVGSNTQFVPWIKLIDAYGTRYDRPIHWLVAPDGDSHRELRRAMTDAGITLSQSTAQALGVIGAARRSTVDAWRQALSSFNTEARNNSLRTTFLDIDLEYTMLSNAEHAYLSRIASQASISFTDRAQLLRKLGSKSQGTPPDDSIKHPWLRGLIGETIPWQQVTESARNIITQWASGIMTEENAQVLIDAALHSETA